jgi:pantoate--beta-alanine ligase
MQVIATIPELRAAIKQSQTAHKTIGFVPTMGYLHEGHLSLIRRARQENDVVVVSIFVNPTQFAPHEDLATYPRDHERDLALLHTASADIVFLPAVEELYPSGYTTYVQVEGSISTTLCGVSRPTFFRGVATIVTKLFHIVTPQRAYFGQKDAQQAGVIKKMVKDLNFDIEIVVCPTVREKDGLAMSSRNTYLTPTQRAQAVGISQALFEARALIENGEHRASHIRQSIETRIAAIDDAVIDYVSIVDATTLADVETLSGETLIAAAVKVGKTRLIDNIQVQISGSI